MTQTEFLSILVDRGQMDWRDKSSATAHSLRRSGYIRPNNRGGWDITPEGEKRLRYLISQRQNKSIAQ